MSLAANNTAIECTTSAQLLVGEDGSVRSTRFNDIYFNPLQGAQESTHVFVEGNQLIQRWTKWLSATAAIDNTWQRKTDFVIAETGFGTGLNFLASVDALNALAEKLNNQLTNQKNNIENVASGDRTIRHLTLYYYSVEKYPLTAAAMHKVYQRYNPFPALCAELLDCYPDPVAGNYSLTFARKFLSAMDVSIEVKLILLFGDSEQTLQQLENYPTIANQLQGGLTVDAWFLDGFAPSVNPDMWQMSLFSRIAKLSQRGSTLATFSVARAVKEPLIASGFNIEKKPGFGKKREMLTATYSGEASANNLTIVRVNNRSDGTTQSPTSPRQLGAELSACYFRKTQTTLTTVSATQSAENAIVVGAGIAGACIANQLSQRGWSVTVVDRGDAIATGASGNDAGVLYARSATQRSQLSDFHEAAFHFAQHFYMRHFSNREDALKLDGMLKIGEQLDPGFIEQHPELRSRRNVTALEGTELAGIDIDQAGIFYPTAGHFNPRRVCQSLLSASNITWCGNTTINAIEPSNGLWQARTLQGETLQAKTLIIAAGDQTRGFEQTNWIPLKAIRGQTSRIEQHNIISAFSSLRRVICGKGYVSPPTDEGVNLGATFTLHDNTAICNQHDHEMNLRNLLALFSPRSTQYQLIAKLLDDKQSINELSGRVGFRAVSPDYLPIVGPVVDADQFTHRYAALRKSAKQRLSEAAPLLDNLFVFTGLGSHGFTYAPLCADILSAYICESPMPVGEGLRQSIAAQRFLIRNLIRGLI